MLSKTTLLIDASIYIFQYYFSLPDHWFSKKHQWPTAAVYGYTTFLIRLLKTQQPKRIAACFDKSLEHGFRHEIYPDYKASRALPDEALAFQLDACERVSQLLGIACFSSRRYEADDLIGSLYQSCQRSRSGQAILTRDKDLGQLLQRPQDFLWDYAHHEKLHKQDTNTEPAKLYIAGVLGKFGVHPSQLIDYLSLVGDSVDDIPGVPGIGKKTAQQLLTHFGSIAVLYQQLDQGQVLPVRGAATVAERLMEYRQQVGIAQRLATIVTDLPLIKRVSELDKQPVNHLGFSKFCTQMGFSKLSQSAKDCR